MKYTPVLVSFQEIDEVLESNPSGFDADYRPFGLFYGFEDCGDHLILWAVDNSAGYAWTEDFETKEEALKWLKDSYGGN
jgi:hypothetical protein